MKKRLSFIFIMTLLSLSGCSESETDKNAPTPQQKLSAPLQINMKSLGIDL